VAAAVAYMAGGTDVSMADGGTGASLTDPGGDRILFWDDSAGDMTWLTASTGLTISGTSMTARTASDTQTGIVELATTAETETGTDTARAVTPDGLHDMTTLAGAAWMLDEDNMASDSATKVASQQSIKAYVDAAITAAKAALMPVGTIVTLGVSTNPGTLYGFGTWTAITDKVIVGKGSSGTFGTLNATGGAETHTLTTAEMPSHTHGFSGAQYVVAGLGGANDRTQPGVGNNAGFIDMRTSSSAGSGGAHNNLQPYIVKYIWERTA